MPGPVAADRSAGPPAPATALVLSAWGHLHGLVVLEVFGHTSILGDHQAEIFRMAMRNLFQDTHSRIPVAGPGTTATDPHPREQVSSAGR
ncbi:TetR-like C-terminal domain-containing protein [Streptomyces kaempferi]